MANGDTEVVIIGGGAAGIAAAHHLHGAGVACLLVEARPRLGGRAWTVFDPSGFAIDLGCGWLHSAERNPWTEVAEQQGRSIDKTPPPWTRRARPVGFPPGEQADFAKAQHAFYESLNAAARDRRDAPAATLLDPGCRWNALINAVGTYITGAELDRVSIHDIGRYADSEVNWRVAEGYGLTVASHGAELPMRLECAVSRIDHSAFRLKIETTQGIITADRVIVTLPTSVLADSEQLFAPALPQKTESALRLPLGLDDKLFLSLQFADEFETDSRLFGHIDRTATATYHFRPFGRPMIEAYFGGTLARDLEAGGERAFFDFAVAELVGLLGNAFARRVKPIHMHRWGLDAFSRGAYSYAQPGHADCRAILAAPVDGRLFFAGEACSRDSYSTAHGAYFTGIAAAEQVMAARRRR